MEKKFIIDAKTLDVVFQTLGKMSINDALGAVDSLRLVLQNEYKEPEAPKGE